MTEPLKRGAAGSWGRAGRSHPGLGTGRGGDVTGRDFLLAYRADTMAGARGSPSETHMF